MTPPIIDSHFVLFLVGVTTAAGLALGVRLLGLPRQGFRPAVMHTLEWVGLFLVCLVVNVGIGTALCLTLRALAPNLFVSLYISTDPTLALLTALQAATFQWWRHTA